MKILSCFSENILLDPAGLMVWPRAGIAVVSDLHLGKGSFFATTGQLLPPYDSSDTLERLTKALQLHDITTLILLGDSVHDAGAWNRLSEKEHAAFERLTDRYDTIWILGNHEQGFVPKGVAAYGDYRIDPLIFRHEAEAIHAPGSCLEVSGHFHPKATINKAGTRVRRACFMKDDNRLILPAFGSFTGGMDVADPVLAPLFPKGFTTYLTGDRIIEVPMARLKA